jgi:hypothetical protein
MIDHTISIITLYNILLYTAIQISRFISGGIDTKSPVNMRDTQVKYDTFFT